jgi:hypothetical protein
MKDLKMEKHTTKYFGEVELFINEDGSWADFDTIYNEQEITVSLSDYGIYEDKIKVCWEIIDKYVEIDEISKKAIIKKFSHEKLKELNYPNLNLFIRKDEITIYLKYETTTYKEKSEGFNKRYVEALKKGILIDFPPLPLRVKMDAKLNVLDINSE